MKQDICVVVPTIREYDCMRAYFENARDHGFDLDRLFVLLVTEDFCDTDEMASMLEEEGVEGAVYDGTAREEWFENHDLGAYTHLIPEASHAQTSFGLLYMWANPRFERGVFIDDDTLPHDEWDFFGRHMENLDYEGELESVRSDERWVNVLYQNADEHGLYPRGYPYSAMDESVETTERDVENVVASQGLWTNVPDLDAVRILMDGDLEGQAQTRTEKSDFTGDFVADPGQYLTVCSMNLAFEREVIPAFYQLPMDDNEWSVGRFDDIWSGVFLKRAADLLDGEVLTGYPLCEHNKAPRPTFDDLNNEVPGLELNEHVWEVVDDAGSDATTWTEAAEAMADALADGDFAKWNNGAFLNHCGEFWRDWLACLDDIEARVGVGSGPVTADD
ncbi:alpha-1 4-glucan-protein synthase [Halogeometricum borinquense]|uniref:Alpha-1 4-glucan-protein synthase n=1 Tax=Halogeometricum borinquense TaxID=60847 RepID=A0A482TM28_9EURY|nr:alpha-1 4-glucan-protein synthase [Halogeometricum borinquense]RYJ13955.1 alpha-1 4-glucan-protein synthase [Halogeometricum borinquense]